MNEPIAIRCREIAAQSLNRIQDLQEEIDVRMNAGGDLGMNLNRDQDRGVGSQDVESVVDSLLQNHARILYDNSATASSDGCYHLGGS